MTRLARALCLLATALLLAGCLAPAGPEDPRSWGHAAWCGGIPPSGYCIVPERGH